MRIIICIISCSIVLVFLLVFFSMEKNTNEHIKIIKKDILMNDMHGTIKWCIDGISYLEFNNGTSYPIMNVYIDESTLMPMPCKNNN